MKNERARTCRDCDEMKTEKEGIFVFAFCGLTNLVVPQLANGDGVMFKRVPFSCPRSDKEVLKSVVGVDYGEK